MPKVTWLGDGDPQSQFVEEGGVAFVKGQPVGVHKNHHWLENFMNNPTFSTEADPEVPEAPSEREALMDQLDGMGVEYRKNASVDALRGLLAKAMDVPETAASEPKDDKKK